MESLLQDLRFGLRSLRKNLGLTAVAVVSLGAGIGAMTTIFTWLNAMVINPLPAVPAYSRIIVAHTRAPEGGTWSVSWPDFQDWRAGAKTADLAAWDMMQLGLRDGPAQAERAWGDMVSGNFFEVLQVPAAFGRVLRIQDEQSRAPVVVLGHSYWRRRFAGDSGVVGRTITLNGSAFTIVGVAARHFGGSYSGMDDHMYVPISAMPLLMPDGSQLLQDRQRRSFDVVGRLKPGATVAQAGAELDPLARRAGVAGGLAQPLGAVVQRHADVDAPGALRPLFGALLGVAGLVLLIACANVANLLLARAVARRREVAVRLAVGASRVRLVRQLLTESLALAVLAGALGVVLSFWGRDGFFAILPAVPYPIGIDFTLSGPVLAFAILVTAVTAMAFGLVPALQASKPDLVPTLKDEIGQGRAGRGRLQAALVIAQVALSLVTLVSAGLFVRSLKVVRSIDTGMHGLDRVLIVGTDLRLTGIKNDSVGVSIVRGLLERVRALPGVEAASVARFVVLSPSPLPGVATQVEGYAPRPDENMTIGYNNVSGDYFRTTGIRVLAGRAIGDADVASNAPVVVVNEAFTRKYLAGRQAIGARVSVAGGEWLSIVGVVATTKVNSFDENPVPMVYRAWGPRFATPNFTLHVRTTGDPFALTAAVRSAFHEVSADLPFLDPRNMAEFTSIQYFLQDIGATILSAVGILALLLASLGIYATMAYAVSRRVREIGVRLALGAARSDVVRLVLGRSMRITGYGLLIGLLGALGVGQALRSMLYGVGPRDPITFAGVGLLLAAVALAASWLPARRAARVDPMIALRSE
ncbi:MAG: ABC transporter permease [Gemmatimonadales bacterium]